MTQQQRIFNLKGLALALTAALALGSVSYAASPYGVFQLWPEWKGACKASDTVDVNLGNSPEAFVKAAYCQINGKQPSAEVVSKWAQQLRTDPRLRRVDVVNALCKESGHDCKRVYSSPWLNDPDLAAPACAKTSKRDIGAVVMFFFNCPGGVNCGMDWANTHAPGMDKPVPGLAWGNQKAGIYDAKNPGFWRRELRDAKYAGLQFILPNTYGPDIAEGKVATLAAALKAEKDPVKVGLFDDTWPWGEPYFGDFWKQKPDMSNREAAAGKLYVAKWKPFFATIPQQYWYRVNGKPLIYFYNSGKLVPRNVSAGVIQRMKELFAKDFGVEPFVAIDKAYFDDPRMPQVADSEFTWYTFNLPGQVSRVNMKGRTLCHAMVRWDAVGRDRPGDVAKASDQLNKGPEILQKVLASTKDADILVLATWNDLGEGTGINRNEDYYYLGQWLAPDYFMRIIRQSQCR